MALVVDSFVPPCRLSRELLAPVLLLVLAALSLVA
jgi:hypothetical protein